jgi:hypothetical protein
MSAIIVFILRVLLALALYAFLSWALFTIWRELRANSMIVTTQRIPPITVHWSENEELFSEQFTLSEIVIGRDQACELPVSNEMVSARHARLSFHNNQWWVEDLQSTNGTYLNDERVYTSTVLIEGDELRCGKMYFQVKFSGKPAENT